MATNKRQKILAGFFYQKTLEPTLELVQVVNGLSISNSTSSNANNKVAAARLLLWKNKWLQDYDWLQFNNKHGIMYCKICKESEEKGVFATSRSTNIKVSTLQDHANTEEHKRLSWTIHNENRRMEKIEVQATMTSDKALMTLFKTTYYVEKNFFLLVSFLPCVIYYFQLMPS